jgi:hypothetical protein
MYLTIVHSRETKIRSLAFGSTEGKSLCMYSSSGSCVLRVGLKHPLHMAFHGTVCPRRLQAMCLLRAMYTTCKS